MPTLLHINVRPRGNHSISRQLGDAAVQVTQGQNSTEEFLSPHSKKSPRSSEKALDRAQIGHRR
jgi:FMN-dependent NADH-azoreductase